MAKSKKQKLKKIEFGAIESKYKDFLTGWTNEYHRYRSYDMVKNYFDKHYDDENKTADIYEGLCIRIFGFLFSWGMRRNNKWLGVASYQVLMPLAEVLFDKQYKVLHDYEPLHHLTEKGCNNDKLDNYIETLIDLQRKACGALVKGLKSFLEENEKSEYEKLGKKKDLEEEKKQFSNVTHLMINKILMATYGCVIAYDDYDRKTLEALNRKHYVSHWDEQVNFEHDENSRRKKYEKAERELLEDTYKIITEHRKEFEEAQIYMEKIGISHYTSFKVLDMMLWQYWKDTKDNSPDAGEQDD